MRVCVDGQSKCVRYGIDTCTERLCVSDLIIGETWCPQARWEVFLPTVLCIFLTCIWTPQEAEILNPSKLRAVRKQSTKDKPEGKGVWWYVYLHAAVLHAQRHSRYLPADSHAMNPRLLFCSLQHYPTLRAQTHLNTETRTHTRLLKGEHDIKLKNDKRDIHCFIKTRTWVLKDESVRGVF